MKLSYTLIVLTAAAISVSCSATSVRSGSDRNVITAEEARESGAATAYAVVQQLRPDWLRMRGQQGLGAQGEILVYFNQARLGGIGELRAIQVQSIGAVRFFDAAEAQYRWGSGHTHGVIQVTTAR